uniref:Eukaryotic translation initiation factor 4E binding protein 3 n=1 Tax=Gasterosteus aculeatus aculeatus TaxID=481459 RepID=A0AAQ4QWP8_GASAC
PPAAVFYKKTIAPHNHVSHSSLHKNITSGRCSGVWYKDSTWWRLEAACSDGHRRASACSSSPLALSSLRPPARCADPSEAACLRAGRVLTLKDWSQLPDCYSQTPGGTLFSTTPGGTRIIYDRKFLLDCRNSPLARTPPCCLPQIPGVTVPATHPMGKLQDLKEEAEEEEKDVPDDNQFEMDI